MTNQVIRTTAKALYDTDAGIRKVAAKSSTGYEAVKRLVASYEDALVEEGFDAQSVNRLIMEINALSEETPKPKQKKLPKR